MNTASCSFWKNRRVLITGYEGFLGSWLTRRLLEQGSRVCGVDIITGRKETILTQTDRSKMKIIRGSVENFRLLSELINENKVQTVFHLAARAIVGECLTNPVKAFATNIKGTWNLLEVCRQNKSVKEVIIASSDKAYGNHDDLPYTENTPLCGNHPYDVSKSCADLIAYAYFNTYGLAVAATRCGNIYGPGDFNPSRLVPDAIRFALKNKQFVIRSDGKFTRDYIYVKDTVKGYMLLAEKMKKLKLDGEAFNFSNENPITVIEIVRKIYDLTGKKPNYKILNEAKYEIKHQYLSSRKARKILGWKPEYSLKQGLSKTIEFYAQL